MNTAWRFITQEEMEKIRSQSRHLTEALNAEVERQLRNRHARLEGMALVALAKMKHPVMIEQRMSSGETRWWFEEKEVADARPKGLEYYLD